MEAINWLLENLDLALTVIGAFAAIAAVTPNEHDNKIADFLLKAINILGANVGKAENK